MDEADGKENSDIAYIKRDDIGLVIAKGLSKLYRVQPEDPVEYLAKWMLNYSNVKSEANIQIEKKQKWQELKDRKDMEDQNNMREVEEELKKEKEKTSKIEDFKDKVGSAQDLSDMLQDFTHFLKEHTGATGVYIGKLIRPNKPIKEEDNEKAHENPEAPEIIKYIHATADHDFMVNRTLTQEQGLTHDIYKPLPAKEEDADGENKPDAADGEGAQEAAKVESEPVKPVPRHLFVPEVVREGRMHYFKVPKLGSYIAVELKYNSCLTEEAFLKAFDDFLD